MTWQSLDFALETVWFGGFALALLLIGAAWLWNHRPWRDKRTFGERYTAMMDLKWREFQDRELERLEAEVQAQGCDIWRPDPERVRSISEAQ